jgi:pilus assembly protein CpaC
VEIGPAVQVSVGKSTVVRPASPVTRILLGNPVGSQAARPTEARSKDDKRDVAQPATDEKTRPGVADVDVLLLSPSEVYLLGKSIGSTNVVLADRSGHCTAFDVVVNMDTGALQGAIGQLLPEEKDVRVAAAFDSVILTGTVSDVGAVTRVLDLANVFVRTAGGNGVSATGANPRIVNMMSTGAPQQVMLEVKVAEVSKALLDRFGINFSRAYATADSSVLNFLAGIFGGAAGTAGHIGGTGPSGAPLSSVGTVIGGSIPSSSPNVVGGNVTQTVDQNGRTVFTTTYGTVPGRNATNVALDMQKTDGLVKILAEPTGHGDQRPEGQLPRRRQDLHPGGTANRRRRRHRHHAGREGIRRVGRIPADGAGRWTHQPRGGIEVSELNRDGVALSAPGIAGTTVLPSFTSRRARTTVQLLDWPELRGRGLIKNNTTTSITASRSSGELPVIGALFRSTQFQTDKSELVFVITPRLVKPLPANYRLPTDNYVPPTRGDVILGGRLEGRREEAAPAQAAPVPPAAASAPGTGFQVK